MKILLLTKIIRGGGGNSLKNNNLNTYTQDLDNGLGFAEIEEIIETPENNEYLASLGLSSKLVEEYPYDVTTIIAYKKNKHNTHTFDKVVYVKNFGEFELTGGQNYTLFLYGGHVDVVKHSDHRARTYIENKEDFDNVYIENENLDFKPLVQRIDNFVPGGNKTNVLPIKMKYPGTHVTLLFDATDLLGGNTGKKITYIRHYFKDDMIIAGYRYYLGQGNFFISNDINNRGRNIEFKDDSKILVPVAYGNTLKRDLDIHVVLKTEDSEKNRMYIPIRNLKKHYRQTIRIKLRRCGAYLGPNKTNWRQFMCHNLLRDPFIPIYDKDFFTPRFEDPFTPSADIHGNKYQWGYKIPIIKQKDDVYKSGPVPGWNTIEKTNTWDNGI